MKSILKLMTLSIFLSTFIISCSDDDDTNTPISKTFTVTVENVFTPKDYFKSGTTGLITPGNNESFSFDAGKGHYLQFATMFVKSNDLFYAPNDTGIALYDMNGDPITGNVTAQIKLWDAGTEVNETPGMGANQPMNQAMANAGVTENGTVHEVMDAFTYPVTNTAISVMIAHDGGTKFTVTINNISDGASLATPFAPGTWVIHSMDQKPMFTNGMAASMGLEKIAEDGDNAAMNTNLTSKSGLVSPFAPGAYHVGATNSIFDMESTATMALQKLAEDGDPSGFTNVFNTPTDANTPGALFPTKTYSFTFTADENEKLSLATMLVQSNDWFFGLDNINLFTNGTPVTGDITSSIKLIDAGTEIDEYAGAGNNQPVRQVAANTGADENGNVMEETNASMNVPNVADMIKVTITAN